MSLRTTLSVIFPKITEVFKSDQREWLTSFIRIIEDVLRNIRLDLGDLDFSAAITSIQGDITTIQEDVTALTSRVDAIEELGYLHVRDEKANNTAGGTSVATTWTKRVLNTSVANTITGASLASDTVTLPAGTYDFHASFPAYAPNYIRGKLRNTSDNSDIIVGPSAYYYSTYGSYLYSFSGRFVIAAEKNIQLQYWVSVGVASGLGLATNSGGVEVYASLEIWKIA